MQQVEVGRIRSMQVIPNMTPTLLLHCTPTFTFYFPTVVRYGGDFLSVELPSPIKDNKRSDHVLTHIFPSSSGAFTNVRRGNTGTACTNRNDAASVVREASGFGANVLLCFRSAERFCFKTPNFP